MSRPNTRCKYKRQRGEDIDDRCTEILRKIHLTGDISSADISQLYAINKPNCQGCRVNSKDSPNCFCGFIPPPNGNRKLGLWQKMPEIIKSLGENPFKDLRPSTDTPAGLTNLGATCYANSILQCLYMNTPFRAGIFSVESELLKQHPVLDQLARLFVQLHSSKMAFIDSAPFIKTLELDNGVQQDSHEFLTLFLSLLERALSHSKNPVAKTTVQDLFRGNVSNVTRCSLCGKDSDASSKLEDFYELELNIKGMANLEESLDDYLSTEKLDGENQYFCESCNTRVDATRSIKLRSLPSVLNFQLKRYVFLPKTTTKKKITSSFSFPRRLNMGKRLCNPSASNIVYDLSAILIHKGTTVNSGHYVAHIKDASTGQWWEFDDEHVSKRGSHPFGDYKSNKSKRNGNINHGTDDNHNHEEVFSSTDAYMLMYTRVDPDGDVDMNERSLPVHLKQEIDELNTSYIKNCEEYQQRKDKQLSYIAERRQEVRSIISEAQVSPNDESYFWVSTDWLNQWADSITPPCIDNTPLQCSHGKVPLSMVSSAKRVSNAAWEKLLSQYGGGPALTNDDHCTDCLKDAAKNTISSDDYRDQRASLRHLAEAALAGKCTDATSYLVSRIWCGAIENGCLGLVTDPSSSSALHTLLVENSTLEVIDVMSLCGQTQLDPSLQVSPSLPEVLCIGEFLKKAYTRLVQWLRRKNTDNPCDADGGPTSSLVCPHGGLLPEQAIGAKRVAVSEPLWLFLYDNAVKVKPDDKVLAFPSVSDPCETCTMELTEVACLEDNLRTTKLKQRQNHEKLILGKSLTFSVGCKYFLVPASWLAKWRTFITTTGKNRSASVEPENLQVVMDSLICEKHLRLIERPLELICKRGIITQRTSAKEGLTLISESDWKFFCEEWDAAEDKGIRAEIAYNSISSRKSNGSCKTDVIPDEESDHSNGEAYDDLERRIPSIQTFPEVCNDCIGERESSELVKKLNYCNEEISVYLVHGKEPPKSIREASGNNLEPERRTSKRSKKSSLRNSINLTVSGATTIYQLKMMIWEAYGVVKENQKLYKGSIELEGDSSTLADKNIFPGDVLWVKDSEIHENRDIADELSEQKMSPEKVEEGFRGTLLTSGLSSFEFND